MMIDVNTTKCDQKEPKSGKQTRRRENQRCLPAGKGVSCTIKLLGEIIVLMAFFYTCFALYVDALETTKYYYLTGQQKFVSFLLFSFALLTTSGCGKLCCRFHFLPNCTQQSTDFILCLPNLSRFDHSLQIYKQKYTLNLYSCR